MIFHRLISSHRNRGFTLVEIALVLGVAGVIVAGIWVAAGYASEQNKIAQATQELQTIVQGILGFEQGRQFAQGAGTDISANMITAGVVPSAYIVNATTIANPWAQLLAGTAHGAFQITASSPATHFHINISGIPEDACIALYLQATNCQNGQGSCAYAVGSTTTARPDPVQGWQQPLIYGANVTPTAAAQAVCVNPQPGTSVYSINMFYSL